MTRIAFAVALALVAILPAVSAQAQAPRTFVSAAGTDNPTCSFAAPCRHFQAAADATSAGGEVDALDPAGYGPITISQAITIEGEGWSYIAPPAHGNGITINAGSGNVTIRGVSLNGVGILDGRGILFNSGASLNIQKCVIANFSLFGILFQPNAPSTIAISDTQVSDNNYGIYIGPTGSGTTTGILDHVHVQHSVHDGITLTSASQQVEITVTDSVSANNGGTGIIADGSGNSTGVFVWVQNSHISYNTLWGVQATGGLGGAILTRSTITDNNSGGVVQEGGTFKTISTYNDNTVLLNGNDAVSALSQTYR